jgi:predicted dehydrogenase
MIHDLYTIYALVEGAMPVSMTAQQRDHEAGGVDLALAQMKWGDGSLAHLQANFLIPDGIAGGGNIDELSAACVGGVLRLTYESGNLTVFREGKSTQIPIELPRSAGIASYFDDALRGELRAFIDLINGDASIPVGARYRDACVIQEWIENFKKSAESEVA